MLLDIRGDEAQARTHCSCPMVVDLGGGKTQVFLQGLWYRDRLVRTADGRRIKERVEEGYGPTMCFPASRSELERDPR